MSHPGPPPRPPTSERAPTREPSTSARPATGVHPATRAHPASLVRAAVALRAVTAALVLAALIDSTADAVRDGLLAQHLSYFTNQSNLFFTVLVAVTLLLARDRRPAWFDDVRGAVAFYLVMTGFVYALLVAPLDELLRWDIGWTGIVLHRLAPAAALLDWLLTPRRRAPPLARMLRWQLYPVAFLALTWLRGAVTGWYPYEFLDPTASSWPQVMVTTAVVLVAFLTIAVLVHLLEGRLRRIAGPAAPPVAPDAEASRADTAGAAAAGTEIPGTAGASQRPEGTGD